MTAQENLMPKLSRVYSIRSIPYLTIAFALIISLFFSSIKNAIAEKSAPEVLILNSYHQGEDWSDNVLNGIQATFKKVYPFFAPSIEHFDTKRFPDFSQLLFMKQYLKSKYQQRHFDLIMTIDNSALILMLKFGEELFPGVPIIFAGVNGYYPDMIKGHTNITGVAEAQDVSGTLNLALTINPEINTVLAVHDYTSSGFAVHKDMASAVDRFKDNVKVVYTPEGTVDDLIHQLKALPKDAIVMILTYVTDKNGRILTREESTRLITSNSPVPVYAMHETRLGYGILGGMLLEGREHGKQSAEVALKVLSGTHPDKIKVSISRSKPIFDYNVIRRFNIPLKRFPSDSIIINKPKSFFNEHRAVMIPGLVVIFMLSVILAFLSYAIVRVKGAEAKIRESEERYRSLFENGNDAIFVADPDSGLLLDANRSAEQLTGYSKAELIGKPQTFIHPHEEEAFYREEFTKSVAEKGAIFKEMFLQSKDGRHVPIEISSGGSISVGDKKIHIGIFRDITQRKQAEERLRLNHSMLARTESIAHIGSWEWEIATDTVTWSEELFRIFQISPGDGAPKWAEHSKLYQPEDFETLRQAVEVALTDGTPFKLELRALRKDGNIRVCEARGFADSGENEKPVRLFGMLHDITDQKLAEEQLKESKQKYHSMVDNIGIGVAMINPKMEIIELNRTMREWFPDVDASRRSICYKAFNDPPSEKICDYCPTYKTLRDGKIRESTTRTPQAGSMRNFRIVSSPIVDSRGDVTAAIEMVEDITERIKIDAQLRQSQKLESIGTLAGGIAHDFNNILSSVLGYTELALDEVQTGTTLEDSLLEVYAAGKRAKDLVKQILAFARQSDEKVKPLQLSMSIDETLKFIRSSIPTSIEIKKEIQSTSLIMGNETQIHQVLMNLCTNAAHALEDDGGTLTIRLTDVEIAAADEDENRIDLQRCQYVKLEVSDTGSGMSPETIKSIFEPYFTTKGPGEGTGMGLALVHGIVESYGGKILVKSELGKGSTFTIYLPVTRKRGLQGIYEPEPLPTGTERILFVDDEASIAKMGSQGLQRLGYDVTVRTSSLEAKELFKAKPDAFDLVITDMTMPNITGDKLAIELMAIRPEIPIILCTGYSKKISDDLAGEIGIKALAYKPIVKADLAKTVRKVLDEAKPKS